MQDMLCVLRCKRRGKNAMPDEIVIRPATGADLAPLAGMLAVAGLLRSLLVAALEASAAERKVRELWLLTIDAEHFFARLAYKATARAAAPAAIQV